MAVWIIIESVLINISTWYNKITYKKKYYKGSEFKYDKYKDKRMLRKCHKEKE